MSPRAIKYLVYGLKAGLFILPVLSLIIAGSLFFPFITGKNFFFRIGVEILFFLWIFIACFDKDYRPKKSPVLFALILTLLFLTLATIFGVNPYRSFWSNYERMEGLIGHIHLFLYFLVLTGVFQKERDWKYFFLVSIGISLIVSIYALLQFFGALEIHQSDVRLDATFGNATYLAIFLIFHLFLIGWFLLRTKNWWLRAAFLALFGLELLIIFLTATRGAILGTVMGAALFGIILLIFTKHKKIRLGGLALFGSLMILVFLFILFKNSDFIQKNYTFNRLAAMSFSERTVESRFTIWKMAFDGFKERPIFGWGLENYNIVFNKYYQPTLWKQEVWFDRSHNIVFDWLVSSGIAGFLSYWSIFGAAIYIVLRSYRKKYLNLTELGLLFALFSAYVFHNFFVFDNLTSYFMFFTILGYLHFRYRQSTQIQESQPTNVVFEFKPIYYAVITFAFIAVVFSLYFANVKPFLAARQLLNTLRSVGAKGLDVDFMLKKFDEVFAYKTFGTAEAREQLVQYSHQIAESPAASQEDKIKALNKAVEEMESQFERVPNDARYAVFLAPLYLRVNKIDDAFKTYNKALELSPQKQQIFFGFADLYFSGGDYEKAFDVLKRAYDLDRSNHEAQKNLLIAVIATKRSDLEEGLFKELEKVWGEKIRKDRQFLNAYAMVGRYDKVKEIWLAIIKNEPMNAQYHVNLAATYMQLGERENAVKELERAIELEPRFKEQGEYFINEIKAGRNP